MELPGEEITYVWEIENFSQCPQIREDYLKSTPFYVDSMDLSQYQLVLYPRGRWNSEDETTICQVECLLQSDFNINVTVNMAHGDAGVEITKTDVYLSTGETIGFRVDLKRGSSGNFGKRGDVLVVRCTVKPIYRDPEADEADLRGLSDDLGRLLRSGLFSDNTMFSSRRTHRMVLATRCPELLEADTEFDDKGSSEAAEALLQYVYTGTLREGLDGKSLHVLHDMAVRYDFEDLKRDLFPVVVHTLARTVVKIDQHEITWNIEEFHERVEPVQTFLDMVIGRFVASFSVDDGATLARVELKCLCLILDKALAMKCVVKSKSSESEVVLCEGEHRFDSGNLNQPFVLQGDYDSLQKYRPAGETSDMVTLVFDFEVSHPRQSDTCKKIEEVVDALPTPEGRLKRSLYRLSSDMSTLFEQTLERGKEGDGISRDQVSCLPDMRVVRGRRQSGIPAHRCLLACRSGQLRLMMVNYKDPEIILDRMGSEATMLFLRYLYCGKLSEDTDLRRVAEIYKQCKYYRVEGLRNRCLQLFRTKMRLKDLKMLLEMAFCDRHLCLAIAFFIRRERELVLNSTEWAQGMEASQAASRTALYFSEEPGLDLETGDYEGC